MKPIKFKESNKILNKPEGWTDKQCSPLHVHNDGRYSISCWAPTILERIKLLFTGRVWLWVCSGNTQPPVIVDFKFPFKFDVKPVWGGILLFSKHLFGSWILLERHVRRCECSYCEKKDGIGFMFPEDKSRNSWRILYFRTKMKAFYLRWTLPNFIGGK